MGELLFEIFGETLFEVIASVCGTLLLDIINGPEADETHQLVAKNIYNLAPIRPAKAD